MRSESLSFLRTLLDTPSPTGFEGEGQKLWSNYAGQWADQRWNDAYGNCFAAIGDEDAACTVAVCGHADEIGLMVNHITDDGFLYCVQIGGIDPATVVGNRVGFQSTVDGVDEMVLGFVGATAVHLQDKAGDAKVRKLHELFVDIGARSREEALSRVNIGDPGVFTAGSLPLGEHLLVARALDNRVGTFAAAETLRLLREQGVPEGIRVVAVSTVQEEVGLRGAAMIAESLVPDVALVTDVTHATDSPGINHAKHGKCVLGGGPEIAIGSAMHHEVVRRLLASAAAQEIALQRAATPGRSGTDTDAIFLRAGGIPSGLCSLPIRYMHTTVETTDLRDLEAISKVYAKFCQDLAADFAQQGDAYQPFIPDYSS